MLARRFGVPRLPTGTSWRTVLAHACAGTGSTVPLSVSDLASTDPGLVSAAAIGVVGGSILAGALGCALLRTLPVPVRESAVRAASAGSH